MKDKRRAHADIHVRPRKGHNIEDWMKANHQDLKARTAMLMGPVAGLPGTFLVRVSYEAHGADSSDLMRPYRETKHWRNLADVMPTGRAWRTEEGK